MTQIHILQPNVANRIAAGEVVERPLSIVKELVENALDASATSISVEIENGGIDLIRISDNGKGISYEDCPTAFLRHATSKIHDSEDIRHIETLGFRGEALASIASVSEVTLKTRERDADEGTLYRIDNGTEVEYTQTACTEGTVIEVKNLFSKVPARLKFLKASRTEAGYIGDFISRMILCYPSISFSFANNGKNVYRTYGNAELKDSIYRIYGTDTLTELIPVEHDDGYVRINGFIGTQALAKPNRTYQTFFVNGRYIKDFKLSGAISRAYDTRMLIGKFPFFVLNIFLSPYEVDINVHPQKMEVRFADEMRMCNALYGAVFRALNRPASVPAEKDISETEGEEQAAGPETRVQSDDLMIKSSIRLPGFDAASSTTENTVHTVRETYAPVQTVKADSSPFSLTGLGQQQYQTLHDQPSRFANGTAAQNHTEFSTQTQAPGIPVYDLRKKAVPLPVFSEKEESFPKEFRLIGSCFNGYLIIETRDKVLVIDQHAAHERLLYEKLMSSDKTMDAQNLLFPQVLRLTHSEMDAFLENEGRFSSLGFVCKKDPDNCELSVTAVPVINGKQIPAGAVYEALELISEKGEFDKDDFVRTAIIQASCKHAVKVTETLDDKEITSLLSAYADGEIPLTCPHGRPVFIAITERDLEKRFKRIQ